jgi:pimeloyl-ACP methyl ester carboxylesterase
VSDGQSPGATGSVTGYLAVDSSRLYYEECGTGPAVVLSHDGAMGAATWDAVWANLCARFHVLRYDRRGVGRSSAPRGAFSQTDDLAALLREGAPATSLATAGAVCHSSSALSGSSAHSPHVQPARATR